LPLKRLVIPGSSGSIWAQNCWPRLTGVPDPKLAPTFPPV